MKSLILISVYFLFNISIHAQETPIDTNTYLIVTVTGTEYFGQIISDDGREVLIMTKKIGKLYLTKESIKSISKVKDSDLLELEAMYNNNGEFNSEGPFSTRYYFTTNCFPVKKGENYAMIHLYGPEVHFSVSKRLSVGVMATWIASPIALALKYTIPTKNEKVNFGLGTIIGSSGYLNQGLGFGGLHWGMVTLGDRKSNLTFSGGYAYVNTGIKDMDNSERIPGSYPAVDDGYGGKKFNNTIPRKEINNNTTTAPVIGLAGITKVGKKASLFFDSMIFFGNRQENITKQIYDSNNKPLSTEVIAGNPHSITAIIMPGMRFQKADNTAFQFALAGVIGRRSNGDSYAFPMPMCSWFFKF